MVTHFNRLQRFQGSTRAPLKDTWKVSLDGMQTEGAVFMKLVFRTGIFLFYSEIVMYPQVFAVLSRTNLLVGSVLNSDLIAIIG